MSGTLAMVPDPEDEKNELSPIEQQGGKIKNAAWMATELKRIIEDNGLAVDCGGKKKHLELEAWTTVARIQNEQPHSKFVRCFQDFNGNEIIEAHAWVTDAGGNTVSEADSFVSTEESRWKGKPFYARASMAQTRAMGKALKLRHSWIMVMAGYEATPADEMRDIGPIETKPSKPKGKKAPVREQSAPLPEPADVSPASGNSPGVDHGSTGAPEDEGDNLLKQVSAKILLVSTKPTSTGGTRYGIKVDWPGVGERWLNTFSQTLGKVAQECVNTVQTILYSEGEYKGNPQWNLEGIER
jgi:hypothetical protein